MEQLQRLQVSLGKPVNASHAFHSICFSPHAFPASFSVSKKEIKVLVICWCSPFAEAAEGISALSSLWARPLPEWYVVSVVKGNGQGFRRFSSILDLATKSPCVCRLLRCVTLERCSDCRWHREYGSVGLMARSKVTVLGPCCPTALSFAQPGRQSCHCHCDQTVVFSADCSELSTTVPVLSTTAEVIFSARQETTCWSGHPTCSWGASNPSEGRNTVPCVATEPLCRLRFVWCFRVNEAKN